MKQAIAYAMLVRVAAIKVAAMGKCQRFEPDEIGLFRGHRD